MAEQEPANVDETQDSGADAGDAGLVDAVDDKAAQLTGSSGAAATDAPVADNRGAVAQAEQHLDEKTDLADDRETLKKLQKSM